MGNIEVDGLRCGRWWGDSGERGVVERSLLLWMLKKREILSNENNPAVPDFMKKAEGGGTGMQVHNQWGYKAAVLRVEGK